jgi:hypothetical protein
LYFHCKEQSRNNGRSFLQPAVCIALASTGTAAGAGRHRFRLSETASQVSSSFVVAPKYAWRGRGWRARNKKPGAVSRPGGWRTFGEYAFLEDSRYTSQEESEMNLIVAA